jgi:hypothetical protein
MSDLFMRAATLNVQGKVLENIDFSFRVEKSLKKNQNSAEILIHNLSQDSRRFLQSVKGGVVTELHAGYLDQVPLPLIFLGQIRRVLSYRKEADWITEISSGDSDQQRAGAISFSLGPNSSFKTAVKRIVEDLKGGAGNLISALRDAPDKTFPDGVTVHGRGDKELEKMLAQLGLEHSWQDGAVQVLKPDTGVAQSAVVLEESSGLIGSPELGNDASKNKPATVKVRSLLNGDLYPGRVVILRSENLQGNYYVTRVSHEGDTNSTEWFSDLELAVRA